MTAQPETLTLHASDLEFSALAVGKEGDPVVLLLHGFPDSPHTFKHQLAPLADAGYRVIAPTLRGYEPSSQPSDGDYSLTTLASDAVGWLDDLGIEQAHLVGHDWGAVITYVATASHPDRFLTGTALAIPPLSRIPEAVRRVPRQLQRSWYMNFFQLRGVADKALAAKDWELVRRLWTSWSPSYEMPDADWQRLRTQFKQPGVVAASLAYYRQNATPPILLGLKSTPAMELTEVPVPMLVVHGAKDGCMDRRLFGAALRTKATDFPKGLALLEISDAGHFVQLERPDEVNSALLEHFQSS